MSLLAGYDSSSEDESSVTTSIKAPLKPQPILLPTIPIAKPLVSSFPSLPPPTAKSKQSVFHLPLLDEKIPSSTSSSSESEEEEDQNEEQETEPPIDQLDPPLKPRPSRLELEDEDELLPIVVQDTATNVVLETPPLPFAFPSAATPLAIPSKRVKPMEELIFEGAQEVRFTAELNSSDIRKQASMLQQRQGGLLAANLVKSEGISGKRSVQIGQLASAAMKQKQNKDSLS
jgi:hypothetical protein